MFVCKCDVFGLCIKETSWYKLLALFYFIINLRLITSLLWELTYYCVSSASFFWDSFKEM